MRKGIITSIILLMLIVGASAAVQELSGTAKTDFRSAKMYSNQKIYEKAIPFYEKVLVENPYHIESLMSIAGIYYEIDKNYINAHDTYVHALEAIEMVYAEYAELQKTDAKAAKKYYKTYIKKTDLEKKQTNAKSLKKNCWTILFSAGRDEYIAEDYSGSLATYLELLEIEPDSLKTIKMIGNTYFNMEELENGIMYYEMAYDKDPGNEVTSRLIAYNYLQLENNEKAVEWYLQAITDNPTDADTFYNLGVVYSDMELLEEAMNMFAEVLKIDNQNVDAIYNAKILAGQLKNVDKYVEFSQMEFDINGMDENIIRAFCYQLNNLEAWEQVLVYGEKWAAIATTDPQPYMLMYVAAKKLGDKDKSDVYQKKAAEMQ